MTKTKDNYKSADDIKIGDVIRGGKSQSVRTVVDYQYDQDGFEEFFMVDEWTNKGRWLSRRSMWDWVQGR